MYIMIMVLILYIVLFNFLYKKIVGKQKLHKLYKNWINWTNYIINVNKIKDLVKFIL